MATDIPTVRTQLAAERAAVVAILAAVDMADEDARFEAAEAARSAAEAVFAPKARRHDLVQDKLNRLVELDRQIALLTP